MQGKILFPSVLLQDNIYNVPICVWIEEMYPQTAPICYVRPTCDMMLVTGKYISSNAEVVLPYLEEWNVRIETSSCILSPGYM